LNKILISPLGTGPINQEDGKFRRNYWEVEYKIEGELFNKRRLLAKVLVEKYKIDRVFFLGTAKSLWELVYSQFGGKVEDIEFSLLHKADESTSDNYLISGEDLLAVERQIDSYTGRDGSKCLLLKYGQTAEELWYNFDLFMQITSNLKEGDEIYLDITHSFRSLSLFAYLMANFIENLKSKKLKVAKIFYGNIDISREIGYAPVMDLSDFFKLNSWTKLVTNLTTFGKTDESNSIGFKQDIYTDIKALTDALSLNNLKGIQQSIKRLKKTDPGKLERPFNYIYPELANFINRFKENDPDYMVYLNLASFHSEISNYALAYIALTESILHFVCEFAKKPGQLEYAKSILFGKKGRLNPAFRGLAQKYKKVNTIRRAIAHATDNRPGLVAFDIQKLDEHISYTKKQFSMLRREERIVVIK